VQTPSSFKVYNASAGSGKTFTLVKSYLKIILSTSDIFKFKEILALTFTNKAAQEMKMRVLENLKDFSYGIFNDMALNLCKEIKIDRAELKNRASLVLNEILNNYSAFSITTIDSFTYKLIRNFAFDLGLSLDFDVELNTKNILKNAVELLISKIGKDTKITNILLLFALYKWQQEKTWDISYALNDIAKMLTEEDAVFEIEKIKTHTINDFLTLYKNLNNSISSFEEKLFDIGKSGLDLIKKLNISETSFSYKDYPNFLKKLTGKNFKAINFEGRLAKNVANQNFYKKGAPASDIALIEAHANDFVELFFKTEQWFEKEYRSYVLAKLIIGKLIPLSVLSELNKCLEIYKTDNNIRLNAEFNQIIRNHIKNEPVPFIYEKIGEKYSHFFIDEMQDTSVFQWENLIPLISNALSQPNSSLFLVGDAKQAIYRWRGGKPEQFINLALENDSKDTNTNQNPFFIKKNIKSLNTNFRSFSEIISFNNAFFTNTAKFLSNADYKKLYLSGNGQKVKDKIGGYVQIDFLEKSSKANPDKESYPGKILSILKQLDPAYNFGDVCILVRSKKDGVKIAENLSEAGYNIVTTDSLLLYQADSIRFTINFLKYLVNNNDKKALANALIFLHKHLKLQIPLADFLTDLVLKSKKDLYKSLKLIGVDFSEKSFNEKSLYQSITYFINRFKLVAFSDVYIQFFLEEILNFEQKQKGNLQHFLNYFEDNKSELSIVMPANKSAIKILTIHKAKGLEFPVVIFPNNEDLYHQINPTEWYHPTDSKKFNNFKALLIDGGLALENADAICQQIFTNKNKTLELDNINLLYVGLTRAIEQLYIITEQTSKQGKSVTYGKIFEDFLKSKQLWQPNVFTYCRGDKKRPILDKNETTEENDLKVKYISTNWASHNIYIVSGASKYRNESQQDAAIYGTLIHDILAHIKTNDDINPVINLFKKTNKITATNASAIKNIIKSVVNHRELKPFYSANAQIYNECEIVTKSKQLLRLDRLVIINNTATVIDYKTGLPQEKHRIQINQYATALKALNINVKAKILVYLQTNVNVIFVD